MKNNSNQQQIYLIDLINNKLLIEAKAIPFSSDITRSFPLGNNSKLTRALDLSYGKPWEQLELKLQKLTLSAKLSNSTIILGYRSDPLHPFKDKFDNTMKILRLLKQYQPKKLIIQTRSSLVVLALDALKSLGEKVEVNLYIETPKEEVSMKLTPNYPLPSDRIKAGSALKNFGIHVNTVIPILLPYGNIQSDALSFARILAKISKKVIFLERDSMTDRSLIAQSLNNHYSKEWLEKEVNRHLVNAITKVEPNLLNTQEEHIQLKLFVA